MMASPASHTALLPQKMIRTGVSRALPQQSPCPLFTIRSTLSHLPWPYPGDGVRAVWRGLSGNGGLCPADGRSVGAKRHEFLGIRDSRSSKGLRSEQASTEIVYCLLQVLCHVDDLGDQPQRSPSWTSEASNRVPGTRRDDIF